MLGCVALVAGCEAPGGAYVESPNTVIATDYDYGVESGRLKNGEAAIAYDPDGCQNWIIDDGIEGYSSPRFDPVSGLPICNNEFPPGAVVGTYQTRNAGVTDSVSGSSRR